MPRWLVQRIRPPKKSPGGRVGATRRNQAVRALPDDTKVFVSKMMVFNKSAADDRSLMPG